MKIKNWKKVMSVFLSVASIMASGFVAKGAVAESLVISDNGSGSTSEVSTQTSNNANVSQSNDANVDNNVNSISNTGSNSTSDNTGGNTSLKTGDANNQVALTTNVNQNTAQGGTCCNQNGVNGIISGNGSGSNNTFNYNNSNNTNINSTNNAFITNNIKGYANTGNNSADNNNGDVRIRTGGIYVKEKVTNTYNINNVEAGLGGNSGDVNLFIKGNGADSINNINYEDNHDVNIITTNIASVINENNWNLNTGNNSADDNVGNVDLATGDIVFNAEITNVGNVNDVKVTCCEKEKPVVPPVTPPVNPPSQTTPPSNNSTPPSGGSTPPHQDTLGVATGNVLPTTGVNLFLIALIGNIAMLFLGMYLRLRSGRSPGAFAI